MLKNKAIFFRIFIVFAFLVMPVFSMAQKKDKRKDRNKCQTVSEQDLINYSTLSAPEAVINHATGWAIQNNGAWYSLKNEIPFSDQRANNNNSTGARKLGYDNFTQLEMRSLMINNKQYNVLIKKYRDGTYEFPVLKEGWKGFKSLDFYVFPSVKLFKILPDSVPFNEAYAVDLNVLTRGTIKNYNHKNWESILVEQAEQTHLGERINGFDLIVAVFPIKNNGKEVCRFRLIKSFDNNYLRSIYTAPNHREELFRSEFYQVKYYTFKNFIQAAKDDYVKVIPATGTGDTFQNYYNWGILKYRAGDYIKAIEYFQKAIALHPDAKDFMLFAYLGNAQNKLHRYNDAVGSYDRALEINPDNVMQYSNWVRNYFNRGVAKYYLGDMEGACKDWNKALELGFGPAHDYIVEYCNKKEK